MILIQEKRQDRPRFQICKHLPFNLPREQSPKRKFEINFLQIFCNAKMSKIVFDQNKGKINFICSFSSFLALQFYKNTLLPVAGLTKVLLILR